MRNAIKTSWKKVLVMLAVAAMLVTSCMPVFAAETQPASTKVPEPTNLRWIEDERGIFFTWDKDGNYYTGSVGPGNVLKFHMELYRDGKLLRKEEQIYHNQHMFLNEEEKSTPGTYTVKIRAEAGTTTDTHIMSYPIMYEYGKGNTEWLGKYSSWKTSPKYVIKEGSAPSHTHEYSEELKSDSKSHFRACECGEKIDVAPHTFGEWKEVKKPTVTMKGQEARTCTVCNYKETRDIPATGVTQMTAPPTSANDGEVAFEVPVEKDAKLQILEVAVSEDLKGKEKDLKVVYDISLLSGNNEIVKVSNNKMKITLTLPENLKDYNQFEIVYIEDGNVKERIPATRNGDKLVFTTTHLSEYGIVATKVVEQEQKQTQTQESVDKQGTNPVSPKTGDYGSAYGVLFAAAGMCLTLGALAWRKRESLR